MRRHILATLAAAMAALAFAAPAVALPANDGFADARTIAPLPFTDDLDLEGAGTEPGEPQWCNSQAQSVWYTITSETTLALRLNLNGSDFGVVFNVYRAWSPGITNLGFVGCIGFGGSMDLTTEPGVTYYVQVGSVSTGPAHARFNVESRPPPPNDALADATPVGALPFGDSGDATLATVETGEPTFPAGAWTPIIGSVWYRFTPAETAHYTITVNGSFSPILAVYTGTSFADFVQVPATSQFSRLTFRAEAGTAYFVQLGRSTLFGGSGTYFLHVEQTPAPNAWFFYTPFDPSTFDTIQFVESSFDLVMAGIASWQWDFGDGSSASTCCPQHRYATDGDYDVGLTITTNDGRTGSIVRQLAIRTHDVAITKLLAPPSAKAGQTRSVTATITNDHYAETAQVSLYRAEPGTFERWTFIASAAVDLPVGQQTVVSLPYTFTADDATLGKATFRVSVSLNGARDAIPADNTAVSLPTKVKA